MAAPKLHINGLEEWSALADLEARVRSAAETALGTADVPDVELSISFVPEVEIRALTRVYHGMDAPTDVLAFDLGEAGVRPGSHLGDIYICPDVARGFAEAEELNWSQEILRLVIHAVLHFLGHDHPGGEERYKSAMYRLQAKLLASL